VCPGLMEINDGKWSASALLPARLVQFFRGQVSGKRRNESRFFLVLEPLQDE
jgi:hypothetical protein